MHSSSRAPLLSAARRRRIILNHWFSFALPVSFAEKQACTGQAI